MTEREEYLWPPSVAIRGTLQAIRSTLSGHVTNRGATARTPGFQESVGLIGKQFSRAPYSSPGDIVQF